MAQTQLIKCIQCGLPLANIDTSTGKGRIITIKKVEGTDITNVEKESSFSLSDGITITCSCGTVNGIY